MTRQFTTSDYLRIITKETIGPKDVALLEGCSLNTARSIIKNLLEPKFFGVYVCNTDTYLKSARGTTRKGELRAIFAREENK